MSSLLEQNERSSIGFRPTVWQVLQYYQMASSPCGLLAMTEAGQYLEGQRWPDRALADLYWTRHLFDERAYYLRVTSTVCRTTFRRVSTTVKLPKPRHCWRMKWRLK